LAETFDIIIKLGKRFLTIQPANSR